MLEEYESVLRSLRFVQPPVRFREHRSRAVADAELVTADYWLRNVTDPVRFTDGVRALDASGVEAFPRDGPATDAARHGTGSACEDSDDGPERMWLPSVRKDGAWAGAAPECGALYVAGCDHRLARVRCALSTAARVASPVSLREGATGLRRANGCLRALTAGGERTAVRRGCIRHRLAPAATPAPSIAEASGHWVISRDAEGLGAALARELQDLALRVHGDSVGHRR
jgi:acyl transferase domain-containing protein